MTIIVGESSIINTEYPTVRVAVTDPTTADVKVLTPYQFMLQGLAVGATDLIVWGEDENKVQQWKVRVVMNIDHYKEKLEELFPDGTLQISQSGETLVVAGQLRKANQSEQLNEYLKNTGVKYVNMTSVAGVQQVQLQVRVAEVSRTAIRTLGINSTYAGNDFFGALTVASSGGTPLISDLEIGPGSASGSFSSAVTVLAGIPGADLNLFFQALAENQYLKILANPTLVALSGEEASFLAGGEFPIPVVQGSSTGGGTSISVEYKEFGVRLKFRPTVLGDGTIRLYVAPEVSTLSDVGGVAIEGFSIPSLLTRRAETTLELNSGQTFAMAGLMKNNVEAIKSRVPGIGDLPILGPLFSSIRYKKNETELVVLVTASLVEPMSLSKPLPVPGQLYSDPNDWEFYLEGRIEGKAPAKIDPADAERLKKMGLDKLIGPGAWQLQSQGNLSAQIDPEEVVVSDSVETQDSLNNDNAIESGSVNAEL
ncbi:MAG: type II and III secretion system protein family protein [Planctomycetota bacterium]